MPKWDGLMAQQSIKLRVWPRAIRMCKRVTSWNKELTLRAYLPQREVVAEVAAAGRIWVSLKVAWSDGAHRLRFVATPPDAMPDGRSPRCAVPGPDGAIFDAHLVAS